MSYPGLPVCCCALSCDDNMVAAILWGLLQRILLYSRAQEAVAVYLGNSQIQTENMGSTVCHMAPGKSAQPIWAPDMSAWPVMGCAAHQLDINAAHTGCQQRR